MLNIENFTAIADCHVHTNDDVDKGMHMLDQLASIGITDISLLSIPFSGVDENLAALYYKMNYDKIRIRVFGGLHYDSHYGHIPYLKQAERLLDLGCDGIKLIEMKPNYRKEVGMGINNPLYDEMFSMLEEHGVPVLAHINDPETFWDKSLMTPREIERGWWYGDGTFLSKKDIYNEVFEMLDKHPRLRVTFAHFFFLSNDINEAERVMIKYPNVNFDLTPGWEMYVGFSKRIDEWQDFFIRYNNRIMYGTDSNNMNGNNTNIHKLVRLGLSHDKSKFEMPIWNHLIHGLDLDETSLRKICYDNYISFVGSDIKPVNVSLFNETAIAMLCDLKDDETQVKAVTWLSKIF